MKILSLVFLLVSTFSFSAHSDSGIMTANERIKLITTTVFGNRKVVSVEPGRHGIKIDESLGGKLKISIDGVSKPIKIKLANGNTLPSRNGNITLYASQTGQAYNINFNIRSDRRILNHGTGYRACTYYRSRPVCRNVCRDIDGRRICRRHCRRENIPHRGTQYYDYTDYSTNRFIRLEFTKPSARFSSAQANTRARFTNRVTRNVTHCY